MPLQHIFLSVGAVVCAMLNFLGYTLRAYYIIFACVDLWRHLVTVNRTRNTSEQVVLIILLDGSSFHCTDI